MNLAKFPRRGYVTEPTPLEALPNFSKALGADINIYIKRDDLLPGTAGGNKTRKLDFSMADAINQGADTIITCGAVQSNHCRLTLAWAVKEGLDCHLVLEERVKDSYNPEASGNNFLFQLLGVKSVTVVPGGSNMLGEMEKLAEKLRAEARVPAEKVVAFDDYVGPGYSLPTDAMVEAVKMLARTEGILLDPVYSGKAMSGLIDLARKGYFPKGSNVLFLHTGGSPALYAYLPTFRA